MSAILSADDLNDFISPGVACIKPIETLPKKGNEDATNPYEVTTEDKVAAANPTPAQISLTDCLACSGCVTSAEAILVSLQSHTEVLNTLDAHPSLSPAWILEGNGTTRSNVNGGHHMWEGEHNDRKLFVATVSPQTRASLAAALGISSDQAGNMISQLLSGPQGLAAGGQHGSSFLWTLDTNIFRSLALVLAAEEVSALLDDRERTAVGDGSSIDAKPKRPILTSACPGWICYAEKTHPHVLPHLSRLKSPQALAGTLIKSVLARTYNVPASQIWHLAVMPCFDKKLEASRSELTSAIWSGNDTDPVRDVDCVITARELLSLASSRGIDFASLPRSPLPSRTPFPDPTLNAFLFPPTRRKDTANSDPAAGTSGGYLWQIARRLQARHPGSRIQIDRGRNADVIEYTLLAAPDARTGRDVVVVKLARYYGFRNIQNLVRKLKPARTSRLLAMARGGGGASRKPGAVATPAPAAAAAAAASGVEYAYVEVMACPGGCTNGGGQIRAGEATADAGTLNSEAKKVGPQEQKAWLAKVDEAYYSAESDDDENAAARNGEEEDRMDVDNEVAADADADANANAYDTVDGISRSRVLSIVEHWSRITGVETQSLVCTSFRRVESDVGKSKSKVSDVEQVAGLAASIGGGW